MPIVLDEKAKAAIEGIINRKKDAIVSVRKDGIVVAEQSTKIAYRTNQSRG